MTEGQFMFRRNNSFASGEIHSRREIHVHSDNSFIERFNAWK